MHEQLLSTNAPTTPTEIRSLTLNIRHLSGMALYTVSSIKKSLEDIDRHSESLRTLPRSRVWPTQLSDQVRNLFNLTVAIQDCISSTNQPVRRRTYPGVTLVDASHIFLGESPSVTATSIASGEAPPTPTHETRVPMHRAHTPAKAPRAPMAVTRSFSADAGPAFPNRVYTPVAVGGDRMAVNRPTTPAREPYTPPEAFRTPFITSLASEGRLHAPTATLGDPEDRNCTPDGVLPAHLNVPRTPEEDFFTHAAAADGSVDQITTPANELPAQVDMYRAPTEVASTSATIAQYESQPHTLAGAPRDSLNWGFTHGEAPPTHVNVPLPLTNASGLPTVVSLAPVGRSFTPTATRKASAEYLPKSEDWTHVQIDVPPSSTDMLCTTSGTPQNSVVPPPTSRDPIPYQPILDNLRNALAAFTPPYFRG
ncbi:hypothetical protein FRC08_018340 [Ceratobasidium sp. 394]|nr:hypothetical protein FRC08_018340 [Ceratobasidium sp. 394]